MIPELRYRNYIVCDYISGSHSIGVNLLNLPSWATESTDNIGVFGTFGRKNTGNYVYLYRGRNT